jgi:hypothetical protein
MTRRLLLAGVALALGLAGLAGPAAATTVPSPGNELPRPLAVPPGSARPALGKPVAVPATGSGHVARAGRSVDLRMLPKTSPPARGQAAQAAPSRLVRPDASITTSFPGITQAQAHGLPPDPSAATNGSQILTATNNFTQAYDNTGATLCGGGVRLADLLGTTDFLTDPRVEYDNLNGRFILTVSIIPPSSSATAAMYVAVSTGSSACGPWTVFRPTFSLSAGNFLDEPMLGQDRHSVLLGAAAGDPNADSADDSVVFAIPKANLYGNVATDFPVFDVGFVLPPEPVVNAGNPMIDSSSTYFLTSSPDPVIGLYQLYRLDGSGSASPALTHSDFAGPAWPPATAPQPGTSTRLDALEGRITWSAVFDGSRVWFAHTIGVPDGSNPPDGTTNPTTVRYGFVVPGSNPPQEQLALAHHSATSADFNPSIGVGLAPNGVETVFLNWVFTDTVAGVGVTDTVDSFLYNGGSLPNRFGVDFPLVTGSVTSLSDRFGDYSSVAVDPAVSNGTCAVTDQQYFTASNNWASRIARVCGQSQSTVPNVAGGTVASAQAALVAAFLRGDSTTTTTACDPGSQGLVIGSSPPAGQVTGIGSEVTLVVCDRSVRVPGVIGDTVDQATAAIQRAGLVVGSIGTTTSCDVNAGEIASQTPRGGNRALIGDSVSLRKSTGLPRNGCQ